jgi:excinuclease ABC subunit C
MSGRGVAAQKVTSPEPADHEVCGWADGMLVRFEVRGGRLASWTQRPCPEAELTDGTPPEWAAFAGRNARLAAVLAR